MLLNLVYSEPETYIRARQGHRISLQKCQPFRRFAEAFTIAWNVCILAETEIAHG
jgi:hypothetical protein